jgi:hypothetical protein
VALNLPIFLIPEGPVKTFNIYMEVRTSFLIMRTLQLNPCRILGRGLQKSRLVSIQGRSQQDQIIFKQLLDPNATEGHMVPRVDQLTGDAFIILAAAADTTGNAMTIATYNVLSNPSIHSKLKCELKEVFPDGNARLGL